MPPPRLTPRLSAFLRHYATATPGPPPVPAHQVFNRHVKHLQRERAALNVTTSRTVSYLRDAIALDLSERLLFINRTFPRVLDLGSGACHIGKALTTPLAPIAPSTTPDLPASKIGKLVCGELSQRLLYRDVDTEWNARIDIERRVVDDDAPLPWADEHFDAVVSAGSMHWINDLPRALAEVHRVLKPDAPFLAAMFGGDSLFELRGALQLAEMEREGGVSPRVSPLADTRDVGGLLEKAGFGLLTVDVADVVIEFPDVYSLMTDLGAMGEGNAVIGRRMGAMGRDMLMAVDGIYRVLNPGEDGGVPATFRVIYMIGWKKGADQPEPLQRGSGETSLKDALKPGRKK